MVVKKSEYQNQFRLSTLKKHQAIYLENLNLRHQRRDREFSHTPLCWEEQGGEDEVIASDSSEEDATNSAPPARKAKEPSPEYQSIAEILYNAKEKADALKKKPHEDVINQPILGKPVSSEKPKEVPDVGKILFEEKDNANLRSEKKDLADKSYSVYDIVDKENKKLNEKLARTYALSGGKFVEDISDESDTDRDMKAADKLLCDHAKMSDSNLRKKTYTKKRGKKPQISGKKTVCVSKVDKSARPQSSSGRPSSSSRPKCSASASLENFVPSSSTYVPRVRRPDRQGEIPKARRRPKSTESPLKERPPFFPYGIGDKEDNLAVHRTHNVRASADQVYEQALKAKIRREEARARLERRLERAKSTDALLEKLAAASPRDLSDWESEYRKQYHGYEPLEYERAVSARSVLPRGKSARAVQRGGCIVVHVD